MSADSLKKTVGVALGVCLVCSILVSTAAVVLKPIQEMNKRKDMLKNILDVAEIEYTDSDINSKFSENISPEIVDLKTGEIVPESQYDEFFNVKDFNIQQVLMKRDLRLQIPQKSDIAKIRYVPKKMVIWFVKKDGKKGRVILPVFGTGLWSTMYGLISIDFENLNTVKGLTFYEHGETPGLGGEIDNPQWKKQWAGKEVFDSRQNVALKVIKGKVNNQSAEAKHQVDGISGATITSNGVTNLIAFWMDSDYGYSRFLKKTAEKREMKNE